VAPRVLRRVHPPIGVAVRRDNEDASGSRPERIQPLLVHRMEFSAILHHLVYSLQHPMHYHLFA